MFGAGVDIHVPRGAVPDGRAVNRAHVTLYMSMSVREQSQSDLWIWTACFP